MNYAFIYQNQSTFKSGTDKPIKILLQDKDRKPVNLTGATAKVRIASPTQLLLEKAIPVSDVLGGVVQLVFSPDEDLDAGNYEMEIEITYPGGATETFPDTNFLKIKVLKSLHRREDVFEASTDFTYLRDNLTGLKDSVDNQVKAFSGKIKQATVPYNYTGAIVTFIDDDNKKFFMDAWKKVCDAKGIRVTLAVNPVNTTGTNPDYMTVADLKSLQSQGYEIVSHTWGHDPAVFKPTVTDLSKVTDAAIEAEYKKGKDWLIENGFTGSNVIVYPWGGFGSETVRYKRLARKYHEYGVDAAGTHNLSPHDNMWLRRPFLMKTDPVSNYQTSVDNALANNAWLIFGNHSQSDQVDEAFLTGVVEYIQSKNIPIMTFGEALKYKGNALSVGEYTDTTKRFYVGSDGAGVFPSTTVIRDGIQVEDHGYSLTTPVASFP
jgi:peptidoglycan/xylan/chitin deacetylase (PgdA/CDA1 family)